MCHCIVRNLAGNWGIFSTSDEGFVNFRLRYRKALINYVWEAIRQVGRGNATDTGELLSHSVEDLVPENDRKHFLPIQEVIVHGFEFLLILCIVAGYDEMAFSPAERYFAGSTFISG